MIQLHYCFIYFYRQAVVIY